MTITLVNEPARRAELLDTPILLAASIQLLIDREFGDMFHGHPVELGEVRQSLAFFRRALAELARASQTPARHPLNGESALNGGPAQTTHPPVGEEPTPGSAAAAGAAARESTEPAANRLVAGASSGRVEEPRPAQFTPVVTNGRGKGRAVGADSAATFTLPVAPEFAVGTADYAGRTQ